MNIAGIGQCSIDYVGMIDSYPPEDTKCEVSQWHIFGGGPVPTALVALSRFGAHTRFMSKIGSDEPGKLVKAGLEQEKVDVTHIVEQKGSRTQTAFIVVNTHDGKRTIFWSKTTAQPFFRKDFSPSFLKDIHFLHLDGYHPEIALEAAACARKLSIPVMLDAGKMRDHLHKLIPLCDYVVCSEQFSSQFGKSDHEKTLKELRTMGVKTTTVTLGIKGSLTASENEYFHQPSYKVDLVDTTGAGDVFHGAYIYGLLKKWPLKEIVTFASAAAAVNCSQLGGRGGIAAVDSILDFMKKARTVDIPL